MLITQRWTYGLMFKKKKKKGKSFQRENHQPMDISFLTKQAKIYSGEKTVSLMSGAGKLGQLFLQ